MTEISFYKKPNYIKEFAKKLKQNQTEYENILRKRIKNKQLLGMKIHRQKPIFAYRENSGIDRFFIADFYYHPAKLIIEIDGSIHDLKTQKEYDKIREYLLQEKEYTIVRFSNNEITNNIEHVLHIIQKYNINP